MSTPARDHALVLGAGIAGLLAARVLAEAYDRVTVVDRDELPDHPAPRRGVPQGRHAHALLARGRLVLEELFPGLTADLIAHGAPAGDMLGDVRLHIGGHQLRRTHTGLTVLSVSRAFLEHQVRQRVRALPGIWFGPPTDIVGLSATPDGHRIAGARTLRRAHGSAEETIDADLVVDATGRGSRTPAWLAALGYQRPPEDRVSIDLGYTSRRYRLRPDALGGDLATLHGPTPTCPRGGVLARLEGGQWLLTLFGLAGDHPPAQPDGLAQFARSMPCADIYQAIRDAEPLDDPVAYRFPTSRRRRYERLTHFPAGLIVLGDGVCSFNPIYGQGMTVAAIEALILRDHVRRRQPASTRQFRARLADAIDTPWTMTTAGDLAIPGVRGQRTATARAANSYLTRVLAAAANDTTVSDAFARVSGLVDPPTALVRPRMALRVLRHHPSPDAETYAPELHGHPSESRPEHTR
jgi:2-polyprenyl-6-methoxyphenol hydroxylase-like FAD-dependent oxidoreductase